MPCRVGRCVCSLLPGAERSGTMSMASHAVNRLGELYRLILARMRALNAHRVPGRITPSPCRRAEIESLESRTLLSTVMWDSVSHAAGGDWDTASNWIGGALPGAADIAVINLSNATVTHSAAVNDTVLGLTTSGSTTLSVGSGSLSLESGNSAFGGSVTVNAGATLNVGTGANVLIA